MITVPDYNELLLTSSVTPKPSIRDIGVVIELCMYAVFVKLHTVIFVALPR